MPWWTRLLNAFRTDAVTRDIEEELRFHLNRRTASNRERGMAEPEAAASAQRTFGSFDETQRSLLEIRVMKKSIAVSVLLFAVASVVVVGVIAWWRTRAVPVPQPYYQIGDDGVTAPMVVRERKPNYPPEALQAKLQGSVTMQCVVQLDGICSDIQVATSKVREPDGSLGLLDPEWLDQEASRAVREWRFKPGTRRGQAVPVLVNIEFKFTVR